MILFLPKNKPVLTLFTYNLAFLFLLQSPTLKPLPLFIRQENANTQVHTKWMLLKSPHFHLYTNEKEQETNLQPLLQELEIAFHYLGQLFEVPDQKPIPIIVSTKTRGGGFANLATNSLELQLKQGGSFPIFLHEFMHRLSYQDFDPGFGPLGRVLKLGMTPTWWIEGIAEYLSLSLGLSMTQNALRYQALTGNYPSWAKMHALYHDHHDYETFFKGYSTSGHFVKYLVKKFCKAEKDLVCLKNFNKILAQKTFSPPFLNAEDQFAQKISGKSAHKLFEEFKEEEINFWKEKTENFQPLEKILQPLFRSFSLSQIFWKDKIQALQSFLGETKTESFFLQQKDQKRSYLKIPIQGSYFWTEYQSSFFTTKKELRKDFVQQDVLLKYEPKGKNYERKKTYKLGDEEEVFDLMASKENFFILTFSHGQQHLSFLNSEKDEIEKLKSYPLGYEVSFAPGSLKNQCVLLLLEKGREGQSFDQVCRNKVQSFDLEFDQVRFLFQEKDHLYAITEGPHLSLIYDIKEKSFVKAFPDWVQKVDWHPIFEKPLLWIKTQKGDYKALLFDREKLLEKSEPLEKEKPQKGQKTTLYPFETLSEKEKPSKINLSQEGKEAKYEFSHLMTYPYASFPPFGMSSFYLISVPFIDVMERQRWDFSLMLPIYPSQFQYFTSSLKWTSFRILQGFSLSLDRFIDVEGYYRNNNNEIKPYQRPEQITPNWVTYQEAFRGSLSQDIQIPKTQHKGRIRFNLISNHLLSAPILNQSESSSFFSSIDGLFSFLFANQYFSFLSEKGQKLDFGHLLMTFEPYLAYKQSLFPIDLGEMKKNIAVWQMKAQLNTSWSQNKWTIKGECSPQFLFGSLPNQMGYTSLISQTSLIRSNSSYVGSVFRTDQGIPTIFSKKQLISSLSLEKLLKKYDQNFYVISFDSSKAALTYSQILDFHGIWPIQHSLLARYQFHFSLNGYHALSALSTYLSPQPQGLGWGVLMEFGSANVF